MGKKLGIFGGLFTVFYLAGFACLLYGRWGELNRLPLNELGDFLAGAFGPLAILWLVLGFFQQGIELRQNSEALLLQARELGNSVEQQEKLAKTANDHLEHERAQRADEKEAARLFAQPKLSFTPGKYAVGSGVYIYRVMVSNNGRADCSDVVFTFNAEGFPPIHLPRLLSGNPTEISLEVGIDDPRQFTGKVRFYDGQGNPGEIPLEVEIHSTYVEIKCRELKCIFPGERTP